MLGSFTFDRFGDIHPVPVGVYRFEGGKIVVEGVVAGASFERLRGERPA